MSTADAARDMDQIRAALGEDKLTYFGFSYGTFLGTVYAGPVPGPRAGARARRRHRPAASARAAYGDAGEGVSTTPSTPSWTECKTDRPARSTTTAAPRSVRRAMARSTAAALPATWAGRTHRRARRGLHRCLSRCMHGILADPRAGPRTGAGRRRLDAAGDGRAYNERRARRHLLERGRREQRRQLHRITRSRPTSPRTTRWCPPFQKVAAAVRAAIAYSGVTLRILAGPARTQIRDHPCRRRAADPRGRDDR